MSNDELESANLHVIPAEGLREGTVVVETGAFGKARAIWRVESTRAMLDRVEVDFIDTAGQMRYQTFDGDELVVAVKGE